MLTPSKIKNHHFEAAGKNAYRAQSVDDFFEIVADSYEQMFKENGELVKKIGLLAERVEEYRNDEDNIRAALLTAQRMADKIMKETNEKSEKQLAEAAENAAAKEAAAEAKAKRLVEQAQHDADMLIAETKQKAERMIEEATAEAKEQAVVARDRMIKTQAALDLVEKEADKFKRELLTLYTEHIELINKIPEVEEEPEEEPADNTPEEVAEAPEEAAQLPEEEPVEEIAAEPETADEEPVEEDVIEEPVAEEDELDSAPVIEPEAETAVQDEPEDEISDSDLERLGIISKSDKPESDDEDIKGEFAAAFATMKDKVRQPVDTDEYEDFSDSDSENEDDKKAGKPHGFKFNVDSLKFNNDDDDDDEYYDDEEDDDDELYDDDDEDEDDDDDDGNFSSKLKGFFKR
ncbi:MAG: DivIVA domain-containing protein [Acutalibacteraceae bacterium]